jgi:transcriptional regulator GlxA family with amidase domain
MVVLMTAAPLTQTEPKTLAAFVFPGFETLDLYGPLEMLGSLPGRIEVSIVGEAPDPVPSVQGQRLLPDVTIADAGSFDLLLVPGGDAAVDVLQRQRSVEWLVQATVSAELVMTVCTGSVLLGATGVLDRRRATTNKRDFLATIGLAPDVTWVRQARWVEDGKFFTSSGVSAGMDMSLAVIETLYGRAEAEEMAAGCEYDWHDEPDWDPFAVAAGLVIS